ncbi:MAG: ABC transporter permease [Cyanobacteria bacterium REEB65]|nr:ABC transporter permease [Cyanobacteria bacterium REEB65]
MDAEATGVSKLQTSRAHPLCVVAAIAAGETSDLWRGRYLPLLAAVWLSICLTATSEAITAASGAAPGLAIAAATLDDLAILLIPLVGAIAGAVAFSSDNDAIDFLLVQPIDRTAIWAGRLLGQATCLVAALAPGWIATFIWLRRGQSGEGSWLYWLAAGLSAVLAVVFLNIGALVGAFWRDRLRTLGTAIAIWCCMAVLWDTVLMVLAIQANNEWFEAALPGLVLLSPVDTIRMAFLLASNSRAYSGPAGAALAWFYGSTAGWTALGVDLLAWLIVPCLLGLWCWRRHDC